MVHNNIYIYTIIPIKFDNSYQISQSSKLIDDRGRLISFEVYPKKNRDES